MGTRQSVRRAQQGLTRNLELLAQAERVAEWRRIAYAVQAGTEDALVDFRHRQTNSYYQLGQLSGFCIGVGLTMLLWLLVRVLP